MLRWTCQAGSLSADRRAREASLVPAMPPVSVFSPKRRRNFPFFQIFGNQHHHRMSSSQMAQRNALLPQGEMLCGVQCSRFRSTGALPPRLCLSSHAVVALLAIYVGRTRDTRVTGWIPISTKIESVLLLLWTSPRLTFSLSANPLAVRNRLLIVPNADTFRCACSLIFR